MLICTICLCRYVEVFSTVHKHLCRNFFFFTFYLEFAELEHNAVESHYNKVASGMKIPFLYFFCSIYVVSMHANTICEKSIAIVFMQNEQKCAVGELVGPVRWQE